MSEEIIKHKPRFEVVDALRGFAVFAILLVHSQDHFMYLVYPDASQSPAWLNELNRMVHDLVFALFSGKSYSIFAFLFGLTFYIQQKSEIQHGRDFGLRFLWRLMLLAFLAAVNAAVFPGGDVLLLYSVMGILLFVVRKWSTGSITILAVLLLCQPLQWILYFSKASFDHQINSSLYSEIYRYSTEGNFYEFITGNLTTGQLANFMWAVENGRMLQTGGLFLLGYLAGRLDLFTEGDANKRFWVKILIISAVVYVPLSTILSQLRGSYAGAVFEMWQKLSFSFVLLPSFVLSYWYFTRFRKACKRLSVYGRMSLSNYISQSYMGMLIFTPFGFNLAPKAGMALSLLIAVGIFMTQLLICNYWFRYYSKGPLEMLWYKLTWVHSDRQTVKTAM